MAAYQPLFFGGIERTGIAVGSAPFLTGALSRLRGQPTPSGWVRATAVGVLGLAVMLIAAATEPTLDVVGAILCLGAGAAYAIYATATGGRSAEANTRELTATTFALAAIALLPFFLTQDAAWLTTPRGLGAAIWLGIGATTIAYLLYTSGLRRVPAPTATTLSLADPLTAAVLGVVLVAERPPIIAWVGALLIAIALVLVARTQRQPSSAAG